MTICKISPTQSHAYKRIMSADTSGSDVTQCVWCGKREDVRFSRSMTSDTRKGMLDEDRLEK